MKKGRLSKIKPAMLAFLLAGLLSGIRFASAQELPVAINPTRIEIAAWPGQRVASSFTFWNGTNGPLAIHLEAGDLKQSDEEGHAVVAPEDEANSLQSWVRPSISDLIVYPKAEITLDFTIEVPANADPRSHWGALLVTAGGSAGGGGGAAVQVRTGVVILARVLGDAKEKLALESLDAPRLLEGPPVTIAARFRNEGTVHLAPEGTVEIRDLFGRLVATSTLPARNVLPGTVRKIQATVGGGFWIGRYTARLSAAYGENRQRLAAEVHFWAVPWKTYGPTALLWAGLIAFFYWRRKNIKAAVRGFRDAE